MVGCQQQGENGVFAVVLHYFAVETVAGRRVEDTNKVITWAVLFSHNLGIEGVTNKTMDIKQLWTFLLSQYKLCFNLWSLMHIS